MQLSELLASMNFTKLGNEVFKPPTVNAIVKSDCKSVDNTLCVIKKEDDT